MKNIKLYSLSGRLIFLKEVNSKEYEINLLGYAKGIYFIETTNELLKSVNRLILK